MAFTAGIQKPKSQNYSGPSGKRKQSQIDRLLTVTEHDLPKALIYGEDAKGNKYEVFVNPETVSKIEASHAKNKTDTSKSPYMGHKIDEKMKKVAPVGSKIIVQKSEVIAKDNGNGFKKTQVEHVFQVKFPSPEKTFEAIMSINYRMHEGKEKVARGFRWEERGIDIHHADAENLINELKEKMDAAAELSKTKMGEYNVTVPTWGFQMRALQLSDKKYEIDGTDMYTAIDTSIPFDWMNGPLDEQGKEIKTQAHTISGEEMLSIISDYEEHISNHEMFKDNVENMRIELCPYRIYPASNTDHLTLTSGDPEKDRFVDRNPLYQMAHRFNYADMEHSDDGLINGKNCAVKGIVQLTDDRLLQAERTWVPSNWINRIHANNIRGAVHAMVRTHDGLKVEPHESLALNVVARKEYANNAPTTQSSAPSSQRSEPVAPAPAPVVVTPEASEVVEKEFNPFDDDPPAPAPVAQETAAPTKLKFGQRAK